MVLFENNSWIKKVLACNHGCLENITLVWKILHSYALANILLLFFTKALRLRFTFLLDVVLTF